jgi:thiol-disulfide isomerase/thioredoxin
MTMNNKTLPITLITVLLLTACADEKSASTQAEPEPVIEHNQTETAITQETDTEENSSADGIDAPLEFALTNLDGEIVNAADYRGKWLILNYWATWCAPCRDEMPELVRFQNEHEDVQILGIAFEDAEIHKLKSFAADFNVNYPLLTIDVYNPPKFAEEGGLGLPTTIVYNPEGMRHKKHMGPIDAEGLAEMLQ